MDVSFTRQGIRFIADGDKAAANARKHGVTFEQASEAFFDPFLTMADASLSDEVRSAVVGMDRAGRVLFVVHMLVEDEAIRLISARRAGASERRTYEDG